MTHIDLYRDHMSFYVSCPGDIEPVWFMLIETDDGKFYLREEYEEDEHKAFPEITPLGQDHVNRWFDSRVDGLATALHIIKKIRPEAITTDLEEQIAIDQQIQ